MLKCNKDMSNKKFCTIKNSELIKSARSVSQYRIKKLSRLITVIGELHDDDFDCDGTSISIYDYCLSRALSNNKCHFMFEYHPGVKDKTRIGSTVIRDVFTSYDTTVRDRSIGIDIRTDFITRESQSLLYNDDYGFARKYGNSTRLLKKDYVVPYTNSKIKNNSKSVEVKTYSKNLNLLFDEYNKRLPDVMDLKWAWAKVMDCTILDRMLEEDNDIDEYVLVVGENHCKNIHEVISTWSPECVEILNHTYREAGMCITTKKMKKTC
jgi:hypothetical protein